MRKRVRLGLGLRLLDETSGRLEILPKKKGKVRVRVRIDSLLNKPLTF